MSADKRPRCGSTFDRSYSRHQWGDRDGEAGDKAVQAVLSRIRRMADEYCEIRREFKYTAEEGGGTERIKILAEFLKKSTAETHIGDVKKHDGIPTQRFVTYVNHFLGTAQQTRDHLDWAIFEEGTEDETDIMFTMQLVLYDGEKSPGFWPWGKPDDEDDDGGDDEDEKEDAARSPPAKRLKSS